MAKMGYGAPAAAVAIAVVLLVGGCGGGGGGAKTHDVRSPWDGTLAGFATEPVDEETNIAVDTWVHVFWPDENFPPPARFTFRLEKEERPGDWGGIHTVIDWETSDPEGGSWWFAPVRLLSRGTWYRIVLTDTFSGDLAYSYFQTTFSLLSTSERSVETAAADGKRYRPTGKEGAAAPAGPGQIEHTITRKGR